MEITSQLVLVYLVIYSRKELSDKPGHASVHEIETNKHIKFNATYEGRKRRLSKASSETRTRKDSVTMHQR